MLADFDQLAAGVFAAPAPGDLSHRRGGPTGADSLGVRFDGPETFKAWHQVPVAELWQWLALMTFLDPSTIPLEAALAKQVRPRSAVRLFQNRVALLSSLERAAVAVVRTQIARVAAWSLWESSLTGRIASACHCRQSSPVPAVRKRADVRP
ncbi:hypothetical protein [Roseateles sp.]|uniref:hypothetical protein n=1 Tax=Roseateles sp. TaxID=1971397 RepID=UPI0025F27F59|nr:hypothetical protein [Roseateles sp.]MBV8037739.1 hypothetical protein [Roseateles sp.]